MPDKKNAPEIRFKGFSEPWEEKNLNKIGETYSGLTGKTKEDFGHGNARFITYMNVYANPIADINGVESIEIDNTQHVVEKGDIFFTTSSETPDEVAMSSVWLGNFNNIYLNSFCFGFHPKETIDSFYIAYLLRSMSFRNKVIPLAQGISRYNVSKNKVMDIKISIPPIKEQQKIGKFFSKIDDLIKFQKQKIDKLQNIKKSMLDKMFPKNGNTVPEIRFKGFLEPWKKSKLGNIYSFKYGEYNNNPSNGGIYPVFGANGIIGGFDKFNAENSVIIGHMGEYAGSVLCGEGKHFVTYNGTISLPNQKVINDKFGYFMLFQLNLAQICGGSGMPFLSYEQLQRFDCTFPQDKKEQQKIGKFFSKIDDLIKFQEQKLEKLKNIKKSMLDKMFV